MKNLKKINLLLALIFVSVALMSFIPSTNSNSAINSNNEKLLTPDPSSPNNLYVGWKTVNVNYRTNGNYYILYSDLVSGLDANHTMTWGCGNLDLKPNTPEWDCSDLEEFFSAYGAEGCEYIYVHSNLSPTPGHSVLHTINIKVKDDQGFESNAGGINFYINYTSTPSNAEPVDPCGSY